MIKKIIVNKASLDDIENALGTIRSAFNVFKAINFDVEYLFKIAGFDTGVGEGYIYSYIVNGSSASVIQVVKRELSLYPEKLVVAGVANVATHPDHRGRGYASKLLAYMLEDQSKDVAASALFTGYGSTAHRIYRRLGFKDITVYCDRVCVLDDINKLTTIGNVSAVEIVSEIPKPSILNKIYRKNIVKKHKCSVIRDSRYWKGIIKYSPYGTWFLSNMPKDHIIIDNKLKGYAIIHYMKYSVLSNLIDRSRAIVTDLVAGDDLTLRNIVASIARHVVNNGVKTLVFRTPKEYEDVLKYCRPIGTDEVFMVKILDYNRFFDIVARFLHKRSSSSRVQHVDVSCNGLCVGIHVTDGSVDIEIKKECSSDIVLTEDAFLRLLLGSSRALEEYSLGNIIIKTASTNVAKKLREIDRFLKNINTHYISVIDKW